MRDSAGTTLDPSEGETGWGGVSGGSLDGGGPTEDDAIPTRLIDDLEDGDSKILGIEGRTGDWYTYNDGTEMGTQWPDSSAGFIATLEGAGNSDYCAAVEASGFTTWGAGLGLDFNKPPGAIRSEYDGSKYFGVRLLARGVGTLRFKIQTSATIAQEHGGTCTDRCGDDHGMTIELTQAWAPYRLAFDEATQEGWGAPVPFDPAALIGLQFQAGPNEDLELYVDDVEFF